MGRPTSLTPEVQATIVEAIGKGLYRETAAQLAGVTYRTLRNWEERGDAGEAPYAEFFQLLKKAEAAAECDIIAGVRMGCEGWQSKAWIAERRWPSRWSGRVRLTVNEELSAVLDKIRAKLDEETFAKVIDATREDAPGAGSARH
jgi:hypothetical protein